MTVFTAFGMLFALFLSPVCAQAVELEDSSSTSAQLFSLKTQDVIISSDAEEGAEDDEYAAVVSQSDATEISDEDKVSIQQYYEEEGGGSRVR